MKKVIAILTAVFITFSLFPMVVVPPKVSAGTYGDAVTDNPVGVPVVDTFGGMAVDKTGDYIIETGGDLAEGAPLGRTPLGTLGSAGKIIKYGGILVGTYDTAKDFFNYWSYKSPHKNTHEKLVDNGLYILNTTMGILATAGTVFVLFNPATAPVTATAAAAAWVSAPIFGIAAGGVGVARGAYNSQGFADLTDLVKGKKKIAFAPFERPDIKDAREIIKEELGFDPYDRSWKEIPDPATGIPVYKPNIYIYNSKNIEANVKIYPEQYITESIPKYQENKGWDVQISGGSINGKNDYLFYEAIVPDEGFQKTEGFVIHQNSLNSDMTEVLDQYQFNAKEKQDFIEYWADKLAGDNDYVFYPQLKDIIDLTMPVVVTPEAEDIYRLWFYIVPFDSGGSSPNSPKAVPIVRSDYTVVEWGGIIK